MGFWEGFLDWLRSLFLKKHLELSVIGLQNAGKTTLANVIVTGRFSRDTQPTIGYETKKVTKGNVVLKIWDLAGQARNRTVWERYCRARAVSAIVYVLDASDHETISTSRRELHRLLRRPSVAGIPLLVLGNKIDIPEALTKPSLTRYMRLDSITDREVCCYMISCKTLTCIDCVIDWLINHADYKSNTS